MDIVLVNLLVDSFVLYCNCVCVVAYCNVLDRRPIIAIDTPLSIIVTVDIALYAFYIAMR